MRPDNRKGSLRTAQTGIMLAILAAALYALNAPLSKILLDYLPPTLTAGFLYIGAGLGMGAVAVIRRARGTSDCEKKLTKAELPYTVAMVVLDIAAPIFLMYGLKSSSAANGTINGYAREKKDGENANPETDDDRVSLPPSSDDR